MKNKKGFTLIELLAVIAILAILVIVALPNVLKSYNKSKEDTFLNELRLAYKSARQKWVLEPLKYSGPIVYSNASGCEHRTLDLAGRNELIYYIQFNTDGEVVNYYATDGSFQYTYDGEGLLVTNINDAEDINTATNKISIGCDGVSEVVSPDYIPDSYLMGGSTGSDTTNYLRTNIKKQDIESITFTNSKSGHTANGTDCFDVSKDNDGGVLAWVVDSDSDGKYEMTIGANGTVYASSGYYLFAFLKNLDSLNGMNNFDTSKVTNMGSMFASTGYNSTSFTLDLGNKFDTSKVTNMFEMFIYTGRNSTSFDLKLGNKFDTSKVTNMQNMFYGTGDHSTIFTLNLGNKFDTSKVTNMAQMFFYTGNHSTSFTLNLGPNFDTSQVTNMANMFYGVGAYSPIFTLDLGDKFDTSQVTAMYNMFCYAGHYSPIFTLDLGDKFDTSSVTNMQAMFGYTGYSNPSFTLDLGDKFDTSEVTTMGSMFLYSGYSNPNFTLDLGSKFDTSKVTSMYSMFFGSRYLKTIKVPNTFVTTLVTNSTRMFGECKSLVGGAGTIYNVNHEEVEYAHIDGGTSNPGYFTAR